MTKDRQFGVRVDDALVERVDRLVEQMGRNPRLAAMGAVTRSGVLRLAILRGVELLEVEYESRAS